MASHHMQSFKTLAQKLLVLARAKFDMQHFSWPYLVTWPDLTLTWKFYRKHKIYQREATENFVALRLAVFQLYAKNLTGVDFALPPPHPRHGAG